MTPTSVLYIDDDPGLGLLVSRSLSRLGYAVTHVTSGDAGLTLMGEQHFDVVALDHYMPGQTGLETLALIRDLPAPPPVVYVTGSDDSRIAVAALKAGAVDYVWKDAQDHYRELLAEAIRTAVERERLRQAKEATELEVRVARDRLEVLLKEVNHRVANSLALIAGFARLQASSLQDPAARAALEEMQARIHAVAGVHRRLYTSHDVETVEVDAYLTSLVEDLQASMATSGANHEIRLDADAVHVPTDRAVSIGVIVTELVTNAYKYAYPANTRGLIEVSLKTVGDKAVLMVSDEGVGIQSGDAPKGTGVGTRVVKAMAANLKTALVYERPERGTRASVAFEVIPS
jgi:two-component sensor histidine kinase